MRWGWALMAVLCGCQTAPPAEHRLLVDLRTDLAPAIEFDQIRIELLGRPIEATVVPDPALDWVLGQRVTVFSPVEEGFIELEVTLWKGDAPILSRRAVTAIAGEDVGVTLTMTRSCLGVMCDPRAGQTCVTGACVAATCLAGTEASCGEATPCTPGSCSSQGCLRGLCEEGLCLSVLDDERCASGALCGGGGVCEWEGAPPAPSTFTDGPRAVPGTLSTSWPRVLWDGAEYLLFHQEVRGEAALALLTRMDADGVVRFGPFAIEETALAGADSLHAVATPSGYLLMQGSSEGILALRVDRDGEALAPAQWTPEFPLINGPPIWNGDAVVAVLRSPQSQALLVRLDADGRLLGRMAAFLREDSHHGATVQPLDDGLVVVVREGRDCCFTPQLRFQRFDGRGVPQTDLVTVVGPDVPPGYNTYAPDFAIREGRVAVVGHVKNTSGLVGGRQVLMTIVDATDGSYVVPPREITAYPTAEASNALLAPRSYGYRVFYKHYDEARDTFTTRAMDLDPSGAVIASDLVLAQAEDFRLLDFGDAFSLSWTSSEGEVVFQSFPGSP